MISSPPPNPYLRICFSIVFFRENGREGGRRVEGERERKRDEKDTWIGCLPYATRLGWGANLQPSYWESNHWATLARAAIAVISWLSNTCRHSAKSIISFNPHKTSLINKWKKCSERLSHLSKVILFVCDKAWNCFCYCCTLPFEKNDS